MKLSENKVKQIAKLANLKLTNDEVQKFQKELSEVLDYVEILNELDTAGVELTSQVTGLINVFREDRVGECLTPKQALKNAKNKEKSMFKTKAIL